MVAAGQPQSAQVLSSLPTELLRKIVNNLARKDLKSLRLKCHKLNDVSSEVLYRTITISHDKSSMVQLENVATFPFWA